MRSVSESKLCHFLGENRYLPAKMPMLIVKSLAPPGEWKCINAAFVKIKLTYYLTTGNEFDDVVNYVIYIFDLIFIFNSYLPRLLE